MIAVNDIAILARSLVSPLANEARLRCAVGRAYYAAYHWCKEAADAWCDPLTPAQAANKGNHEKIYVQMERNSQDAALSQELRVMAEEAKKLRQLRVTADYTLSETISQNDLTRGFALMERVKTSLSELGRLSSGTGAR